MIILVCLMFEKHVVGMKKLTKSVKMHYLLALSTCSIYLRYGSSWRTALYMTVFILFGLIFDG